LVDDLVDEGTIEANGTGTILDLANVSIDPTGNLVILNGATAFVTSSLTNSGTVTIDGESDLKLFDLLNSVYYSQTPTGVLDLQLGSVPSITPITATFLLTGSLSLAGTLEVTYVNGFSPSSGQSFLVISAGARTGTFDTVIGGTAAYRGNQVYFIVGSATVVAPTSLQWDTTKGGVDYGYQVSNGPVPQDTKLGLYWSSSNQFSGAIRGPVYTQDIPVGTAIGSYGLFNVPVSKLGTPPQAANYLLAVTDPGNVLGNFSPTTNVRALAYARATQLVVPTAAQPPVIVGINQAFQVQVLAEDANGEVDQFFSGEVTMNLPSSPSGATLGGTTTVTAVNGVATFSNLTLNKASVNYTLQATSNGLSSATTNGFTVAYTPAQIRAAYGFSALPTTMDGAGQTIAIVVENDDPNLLNDVQQFDAQFSLTPLGTSGGPNLAIYTVLNGVGVEAVLNGAPLDQNGVPVSQSGNAPVSLPPPDLSGGWADEEAQDVEWAHAIAPGANIDVVEVYPSFTVSPSGASIDTSLLTGAQIAGRLPGVSAVSMSWGAIGHKGDYEDPSELTYDQYFVTPGVTFIVASGDDGSNLFGYPAASPNVVAVGGTSLQNLDAQGDYPGTGPNEEIGWSGSGGGVSLYESQPSYQSGEVPAAMSAFQGAANRTIPDVSFDADKNTGVFEYSSYNPTNNNQQWTVGDGTSLGAPCWAGLIAIVNQGRAQQNRPLPPLNGPTQTLPALYTFTNYFHDITNGKNGSYSANAGYDLVTGLGTPIANLLIPALVHYAAPTNTTVMPSANPSVNRQVVTFTATVTSQIPGSGTPTGEVQFVLDGENLGSPVALSATGMATSIVVALSAGSHTATANYINSDGGFVGSSGSLAGGQQVNAMTSSNLQNVIAQALQSGNPVILQADRTQPGSLTTLLSAVNGLQSPGAPITLTVDLQGGTYSDQTTSPPGDVSLVIQNGSLVGDSPALTATGGEVELLNCALSTATDASTILLTGGHLSLQSDIVQESAAFTDAAIDVTAGTLDLGTAASPGGNVLNINGAGEFVHNGTPNAVPATGDSFEVNGTPLSASYLSFTAISSSSTTSVYGQTVTLTATVQADAPAYDLLEGSVDFVDVTTGTDLGSLVLAGGGATLSTAALAAGTHLIRATYSGDSNFTLSLDAITATVNPSPLTITANDTNKAYGAPDPTFTVSYSGFVNHDTSSSLVTAPSLATSAAPGSPVGSYAISASGGVDSNYTIAYEVGTLTVNPYAFSYVVGNDSQTYGSPADLTADLPATISTGVNGENLTITYGSSGDTATASVGSYAITGSLANGTGLLSNYDVTLTSGTLAINPYVFSYAIGNDSQTYGAPANLVADLPATINTGVNGENLAITCGSSGDTATANVGSYAITGTLANGTGFLSNYDVTLTNGTAAVYPYVFSYAIGNDSQTYGIRANLTADLPATISTGVNGENLAITYGSSGDTATANVGSYAITGSLANGTGVLSNYDVTLTNGTLAVYPIPTASLSGTSHGVLYQPLTFTIGASDLSPSDQAGNFTYAVNWGDDTTDSVFGPSTATDTHAYATAGSYSVTLAAKNQDGAISTPVNRTITIAAAPELQNGVLTIPGTASVATITLTPTRPKRASAYSMNVSYTMSGKATKFGPFAASTIEVYDGPGTDAVTLSGTTSSDAFTVGNGTVSEKAAQSTSFTVDLNAVASITINGAGGSDSLTGPNQKNAWAINGKNAGTLNSSIAFKRIQNLTGGSVEDTFTFLRAGSITGNLNGEAHTNMLDYAQYGSPVTINLQTRKAPGIRAIWAHIQNFVGTGTTSTLVAANTINTWSIGGTNAGTVDGISFSGFPNLTGGNTNDTFAFLPGGSIVGNLKGVATVNSLDYSGYGRPVTVNLHGKTATGIGGTWASIQAFIGTGTTDTLVGANSNSTWSIPAPNAGTVGTYSFSGFSNLTGGTGNDIFKFAAGASVTGTVDGQAGTNTLDYAQYGSPVTVNLQERTTPGIGDWANFQSIKGTNTTDTLIATDGTTNRWALKGSNAGTVDGVSFTGFANLTGGSGADDFQFAAGAKVLGVVDGGGGSNSLDYSAYTAVVAVNLGNATTSLANRSATAINGGAANGIANIGTVIVGSGNNYLTAVGVSTGVTFTATGNGNNILVGGSGNNTMTASSSGNNIIIGDQGSSTLNGGTGYNLLIGGHTNYDAIDADLQSVMAIWKTVNSARTYATAVSKLTASSYAYSLSSTTVHANANDTINAGTHAVDWYFATLASEITGKKARETVTLC